MITHQYRLPVMTILDLSVFGLPFAQAIGRWGNYFNQELYGWPTSLPWGLYIEPQFRLRGLESFSRFHPLFLYESIAMTVFGVWVWVIDRRSRSQVWTIGSGFYFWLYLTYYAVLRFGLDFMRPDKAYSLGLDLGTNQLVLIVVMVIGMLNLVRLWRARHAS
jgi:phosphatidylglycerol:prolipoprotein diacylglycerol transferase